MAEASSTLTTTSAITLSSSQLKPDNLTATATKPN